MILVYGNYAYSYALSTTNAGFAALTPLAALSDGRTGGGTSFSWCTGAQTTATTCTLTGTLTSNLGDATAIIGGVSIANCTLPAGTKITVNGVTQRLVAGARGERNAYFLPQTASNTLTITIFNDVNSAATLTAGQVFSIGEIHVGRAIDLPASLDSPYMAEDLNDPTMYSRSDGQQLYSAMRKPVRGPRTMSIGPFTTNQARGDVASTLYNGNLSTGVMDIKALRDYLTTSSICSICETPYAGQGIIAGVGPGAGKLRYDVNFMQTNFMCAKLSPPGQITMDKAIMWSWYPTFVEAC